MKDLDLKFPSAAIASNYVSRIGNCDTIEIGHKIIQDAIYENAPPSDFVDQPHEVLVSEAIYSEEYYVKVRYYGDEEAQSYLNLFGYLDTESSITIMGGDIPYNTLFVAIANA
jgi:hypothetical protein